jgi:hypothetical protein
MSMVSSKRVLTEVVSSKSSSLNCAIEYSTQTTLISKKTKVIENSYLTT